MSTRRHPERDIDTAFDEHAVIQVVPYSTPVGNAAAYYPRRRHVVMRLEPPWDG